MIAAFPSAAQTQEPSADPVSESQKDFGGYVDEYHAYVVDRIDDPVLWFDSFFGDKRIEDESLPATFIRLRVVSKYTEGEEFTFPIRLNANVRMPNVNERFRLIVTGKNEDELRQLETDDTIDSATPITDDEERTSSVGLRYTVYRTLRQYLNFGGGLRVRWPLEYYFRARYHRYIHMGSNNLIRFTETGFWNSIEGFGETSRLDLERKLSTSSSGRISLFGTYTDDGDGLKWGAEASLFKQLDGKSAGSLDYGAYGVTRPHTEIETYRLGTRYRRNMFRPWFFVEIEPEVNWRLNESGGRDTIGAISLVFEFQFISK